MMEEIAKEESTTVRPIMFEDFKSHNVNLMTKTKVTAITNHSVEAETEDGSVVIPCDYVVLAVGAKSVKFDTSLLEDIDVHVVGDCKEARDINRAIEEGYLAANSL